MTHFRTGAQPPPPPTEAGGSPPFWQGFRRDRRHKVLGGVCAGLGRQCGVDPVIFRVVLSVLAVAGGIGLIVYGVVWLVVPFDDGEESEGRRMLTGQVAGPGLAALLSVLVGCGVFLSTLGDGDVLFFSALVLVLTAGAGYWSRRREGTAGHDAPAEGVAADAPPETKAPPVRMAPSWWREQGPTPAEEALAARVYLWGPPEYDPEVYVSLTKDGATATSDTETQRAGGDRREGPAGPVPTEGPDDGGSRARRYGIGGWTFLAALIAGVAGAASTWESEPLRSSLVLGLSLALAAFGTGLAVGAFVGRIGGGTIVLALITCGLLAASAALPKDITAEWQTADWRPTSVAAVRPEYRVGTGTASLDLRDVPFGKDDTVRTDIEVKAGRLEVLVPAGTRVELRSDIGFGGLRLPDYARDRVHGAVDEQRTRTLPARKGAPREGTLILRTRLELGELVVDRAH
ncbi:PspC domain-containing protein [Streptomyces sp. SID11385]|uniref:PspC domain-containing protein n=1 Tax=Streptomyces sp. SID11385 TaxID=2706031 RepID=UPI0013C5B014|nr:PspC domain-containing protein [Streptomyces sp. SID11385]NEA40399.1 PspC domain-containing protein [Streptomyces sp. SID11385]